MKLTVADLATSGRRFLAWWIGELASCVPARLRRALRPARPMLVLSWAEDGVALELRRGAERRALGRLEVAGAAPGALRTELDRLAAPALARRPAVVFELAPDRVLQRRADLPLAALDSLREVLGFELDRLTPFRAEEAAWDFQLLATDREAQRLSLRLAVTPRATLEAVEAAAAALGVALDRVSVADGSAAGTYDLRPAAAPVARPAWRRLTPALAGAAAVLLLLAIILPMRREAAALDALEARIAAARAAAAETVKLRDQLAVLLQRRDAAVRQRADTPLVAALLAELTRRLPDDSWLTQLHLRDGQLAIGGLSAAATALVPRLEASPLLDEVRFAAPVTPDGQTGHERFSLVARIGAQAGAAQVGSGQAGSGQGAP